MLAFSAFAGDSSILYITAKVPEISPTFSLQATLNSSFTSYTNLDSKNGSTATLNAGENRFINGKTDLFNNTTENDTLVVYFRLLQTESRYASDVKITMTFTPLVYQGRNSDGLTTRNEEDVAGNYYTDLPVVSNITKRPSTIGLEVGDFTTTSTSTTPTSKDSTIAYTSTLDYSIFGYFIPSNTELLTFTATYNMPVRDDNTTYMPYGDYKGSVTVLYESI